MQSKADIERARAELRRRGLSAVDSSTQALLRRMKLKGGVRIGDHTKSWDVLETLRFIEKHLPRTASILDIGAFASEVPVALHRMGYSSVHAIDLNPDLLRMPHSEHIGYRIGNFLQTPYPNASMAAVTAISVIEHGFDSPRLLREIARVLRTGGYFIASFDYWPAKIDTRGVRFFGMDWLIFSRDDVLEFCRSAQAHGLRPVGDLSLDAKERAIACAGHDYTFAWLALQRQPADAAT